MSSKLFSSDLYLYRAVAHFDRNTAGFSEDAVTRSKGAQLKLETYYKRAVDGAIERNKRYVSESPMTLTVVHSLAS